VTPGPFARRREEGEGDWLSVSDLMAGLMVVFLFIAIAFLRPLSVQNERIRDIATAWQANEAAIRAALMAEFGDDLPRWNAEIEEETLLIRFRAPDVLFREGSAELQLPFEAVLAAFFPRYAAVLRFHRDAIEEVRIEGHTSSDWGTATAGEEAYFRNMALSQARTRAVLQHALTLPAVQADRDWLQPLLTANGLSSSRPILGPDGAEDREGSRRVEFRVRTRARGEIMRILEAVQ
jgi:outer membrane protein OmpA-like peptidoglycan-associated protein